MSCLRQGASWERTELIQGIRTHPYGGKGSDMIPPTDIMSGNTMKKIPIMIVTLVIGFIMVTTAVIPLAADYSDAKTFTNEGYFNMKKYGTDVDSVITWDHTAPRKVTVNDTIYDLNTPVNTWVDIVVGDDWFIRYAYGGSVSFMGFNGAGFTNQILASVGNGSDMSATLSAGTITVTVVSTGADPVVKSTTYTEYYAISGDKGEYVMKDSSIPAYMDGDSEIYAIGSTDVFSGSAIYKLTGTINDGVTVTPLKVAEGVTNGDATTNTEELQKFTDSYRLTSITFNAMKESESATITYTYFIVPYEVSLENDNPPAYKGLVSVIPLMALVVLVAAAAGMLYLKGKE